MAEIAADKQHPIELRARMYAELAHYVYPKRKAVDMHHDGLDEPYRFTINIGDPHDELETSPASPMRP